MRIDNGRYREIVMNWTGITPPLKAGTPIAADGTISNDANAVGLVADTLIAQYVMPRSIFVLDAGDVDLAEVEAESGLTLADDCKRALAGITFHSADGTVPGAGMTLTVTAGDDATTLDKTWNQIVAAINRGIIPFYMYEDNDAMLMGMVQAYGEGSTGDDATPWWIGTSDSSSWQADDPDGTLTLYVEDGD